MRAVAPCLNCRKRAEGCHSNCEAYLRFKEEHSKEREEREKILNGQNNHLAYLRDIKTKKQKKYNK